MSRPENWAVTFDLQGKFRRMARPDIPLRADEIEVEVALSTVNPIDAKRRYGYGRKVFQLKGADASNLALGNDYVGTVASVGNGVADFKPGDRVFGVKPPSKHGPHALRVVVKRTQALKANANLPNEILVSLPYNTCTVLRSLESIGIQATSARGKRILVAGASGGLGTIALGLLCRWGAEVTAIDRIENHARCLALGAQSALTDKDLESQRSSFDAVLNFASWELDAALCRTLRPGAMGYATTVHPLLTLMDQKGLVLGAMAAWNQRRRGRKNCPEGTRYAWTLFDLKAGDLEFMQNFALSDPPQLHVGIRAPMSQADLAFSHVEQMRPGRALLTHNAPEIQHA